MIRWHFPIFTDKINNMEYQIIPIESIKRIETWLTTETGFSRSMLHGELDYISDVYLLPKKFAEVQDLYLSIRKEEQNIPYPNRGTDEDIYEFCMTVGKNLILESGSYQAEYIETLWNTYNTLNPQLHSRSATYKRNGLLIRKTAIKSSRPFQCAYYPLTP